ncbi:hypothetical protein COS66_00170 [Candidatus Berkelbacteria bacterium CG06_land_8_20_14_3_00_43_10]|nr:MAG: hypothetical protein COS66_00170 [Candidatus Berkelbacteria bacterium CG06_land_8_20_14_3_00_43_10]
MTTLPKKKKLKIAIIGPPNQVITKNTPGGTEIFTYNLCRELTKLGHKVTLFASKSSKTDARLITNFSSRLMDNPKYTLNRTRMFMLLHLLEFSSFVQRQKQFDLVHISVFDAQTIIPLIPMITIPHVMTVHGPFIHKDIFHKLLGKNYPKINFVSVSKSMAKLFLNPYPSKVIYNGIEVNDFIYKNDPEDRYLWIGRIQPEKGLKEAIEVARATKINLDIYGRNRNPKYFNKYVKKYLSKKIKYHGPATHFIKNKAYGRSKAFIFPTLWDKPFGLVVAESMACGTPVITYNKGAMSEIIESGKTGFVINSGDTQAMIEAIKSIESIHRSDCRKRVEDKFTLSIMGSQYEKYYYELLEKK